MSTRTVCLFCALLILSALITIPLLAPRYSTPEWQWSSTSSLVDSHPIPRLMDEAEIKFRDLLSKQSTTFEAAVTEYRRRYHRNPPKGFDDWFSFAQQNDVKLVDEYDGMINDLAPFWDMSGEEIRRRALQVGQLPSIDLVRLKNGTAVTMTVQNKTFNDSEASARAKGFRVMIEKFQKKLPDMDFPINAKAEGRILVPWEHKMFPNISKQDSSYGIESMLGGKFIPDWKGDGNVWEAFRRTCDPSSQARRLFGTMRSNTQQSFLSSPQTTPSYALRPDDDFDFCSQTWARYQHGHFFSDWRTIPVLYPVFSPAKAPGFSDILIPSHYYYSSTKRYTYGWNGSQFVDVDVPWEEKSDTFFWRGATTGGGSSPAGFSAGYQRHRLLEMTGSNSNVTLPVIFADPNSKQRNYITSSIPLGTLNSAFMNISFTKAVGCVGNCENMRRRYPFSDPVPMDESWRYKYLIDVDGMGYSARMMAIMASESALVKATVYREFWTDWIQPWLHYIPLSQSYKEVYNIRAFFSGMSGINMTTPQTDGKNKTMAEDGDKRLRHIAQAGRQWKNTIGRKVDMEAYVYRLCLEYARLWADDRGAMSFSGREGLA